MDTFKETDLEVIVDGQRCLAEGLGASWVDGEGIKATSRAPAVVMWVHTQDTALPFPFTLAQFRAFCEWHPTFEWEAIEGPFTNDDGTLDEAALSELSTRGADAAQLVRQVLGVRSDNSAFEILPCPREIPPALLALDSDTAVTALRHWFDFAIEETTNAGQLNSEIEQRIKDQAAGLFSIDEAACIIAGKTGEWPKEARTQIWQAIDEGRIKPVSYKTRASLRLPLTGTNERLALVRTNELANVFEAWPFKPAPQTVPATAPTTPLIKAPVVEAMLHITRDSRRSTLQPVIEHAQSLCKEPWDTAEVWGQLHTLTAQKYTVLLHLEGNAVFYTDGDNTKKLTRKNLGERLVTAKKKLGFTV